MAMAKVYETLTSDAQDQINLIVETVKSNVSNDGELDLVLLMATLEKLNELKKETKEHIKEEEKEKSEAIRIEAELLGKAYAKTLKVGENITFKYGTGGKQIATLPMEKLGDKTVQVTYTPDMLPLGSKTSKRNIRFDKIVVPEGFTISAAA